MTLYEFKALDQQEQYNMLWDKGIYHTHIVKRGYTLALYQIDAFYVELKYDGDMNKIASLRSFLNTNQLEPYLNNIELPRFD